MKLSRVMPFVLVLLSACEKDLIHIPPEDNIPEEPIGNIAFIGRFDFSDESHPVFMHSGSTIRAKFSGTRVVLKLEDECLRNYFQVRIDGRDSVLVTNRADNTYILAADLKDTVHNVEIFRRTEWHGGDSRFIGFEFNEGARLLEPDMKSRTIEFIGDSYLCGYGNEGTIIDREFTYATENAWMSYGAISARKLNSEYVSVCYSGIGIVKGKDTTFTMANYYDKVTNNSSVPWNYTHYRPALVVIGLGSNDIIGKVDSTSFINAYVDFLERIRRNYSEAPIVCLAGPYSLLSNWQKLRNYVSGAVSRFSEIDDQVYYFQFTPVLFDGLLDHPAVIEHQQLANELVPYLRQIMNWN